MSATDTLLSDLIGPFEYDALRPLRGGGKPDQLGHVPLEDGDEK